MAKAKAKVERDKRCYQVFKSAFLLLMLAYIVLENENSRINDHQRQYIILNTAVVCAQL